MGNIFMKLAQDMADKGSIEKKYISLYGKTAQLVTFMVLNIAAALTLGAVMNMWWETVVLLAVVIPLRSYAGGYHAGTYTVCFFESMAFIFGAIVTMKYCMLMDAHAIGMIISFLASVLVILICAPVSSPNRILTLRERKKFRIISIALTIAYCVIAFLLMINDNHYCYSIIAGVMLCALSIIMQGISDIGAAGKNVE